MKSIDTKIIVPKKYTPIIIVVDNDILRSGESEFNTIKKHFNFKSFYYVEPNRGVSSVRNCLLEKATLQNAKLIAFIDDDELAHNNWLMNMLKGLEKYQCNIIFFCFSNIDICRLY